MRATQVQACRILSHVPYGLVARWHILLRASSVRGDDPVDVDKGDAAAVTFAREEDTDALSGVLEGTVPPELDPQEKQTTMFTFCAQLTWGLNRGPQVNLPVLFRDWVKHTS